MNAAPVGALLYYAPATVRAQILRWDVDNIDRPGTALRELDSHLAQLPSTDAAQLKSILREGRSLWVISRLPAHSEVQRMLREHLADVAHQSLRLDQGFLLITRLSPGAAS